MMETEMAYRVQTEKLQKDEHARRKKEPARMWTDEPPQPLLFPPR